MKVDNNTHKEIGDDESEHTWEFIISSNINQYGLDHHQQVSLLGQAYCWCTVYTV